MNFHHKKAENLQKWLHINFPVSNEEEEEPVENDFSLIWNFWKKSAEKAQHPKKLSIYGGALMHIIK